MQRLLPLGNATSALVTSLNETTDASTYNHWLGPNWDDGKTWGMVSASLVTIGIVLSVGAFIIWRLTKLIKMDRDGAEFEFRL